MSGLVALLMVAMMVVMMGGMVWAGVAMRSRRRRNEAERGSPEGELGDRPGRGSG
jgi:type II secretory pathway component PulK